MKDQREQWMNAIEVMCLSHFVAFIEWEPKPEEGFPKLTANWLINEFFGRLKERNLDLKDSPVPPIQFREFLWFLHHDLITGPIAKKILDEMFETKRWASQIILEKNYWNEADDSAIEKVIDEVIANNADKVVEYKNGKVKLFGSFVGQCMKALQGKADPKTINEILKKKLEN